MRTRQQHIPVLLWGHAAAWSDSTDDSLLRVGESYGHGVSMAAREREQLSAITPSRRRGSPPSGRGRRARRSPCPAAGRGPNRRRGSCPASGCCAPRRPAQGRGEPLSRTSMRGLRTVRAPAMPRVLGAWPCDIGPLHTCGACKSYDETANQEARARLEMTRGSSYMEGT